MISSEIKEKRKANRLLIKQEHQAQASILEAMPCSLNIETGAICPLRCPFCPQTYDDFDLSREFLQYNDFKKIVDYFDDSLEHINLFNWGEPFLNDSIADIISYASSREIATDVHSTLNYVAPELMGKLFDLGLTRLTVSLDGATEETYQGYRKGGSFRVAYGHLKELVNKQKELRNNPTQIVWKFLVFRHNEHEIEKVGNMAHELGVTIDIAYAAAFGEYVSTLDKFNSADFDAKFSKQYDSQCAQLWIGPTIHSNGDVLPCCQIYHRKYVLGNLFRQDFKEIWNGEKYQSMRKTVSGSMAPDSSLFCARCYFYSSREK